MKICIQYLVLGFELTTSWRESPPTTTRPGLQSQQFCVLQWKYFSYPYHLSSAVFNLQNLSELRHLFLLYKWSCENNLNLIYFLICILFNQCVHQVKQHYFEISKCKICKSNTRPQKWFKSDNWSTSRSQTNFRIPPLRYAQIKRFECNLTSHDYL